MEYNFIFPSTLILLDSLLNSPELSPTLTPLNQHSETYLHSQRVAALCIDLGVENKLTNTLVNSLGKAALLHDIGKINIPFHILNKPGKLQQNEFKIMQQHVRSGYLLTNTLENRLVAEIIVRHHEFGKNPYPRNGADRRIQPRDYKERRFSKPAVVTMAMILALADLFDALVQERVYKPRIPLYEIETILKSDFSGQEKLILQILNRYPV